MDQKIDEDVLNFEKFSLWLDLLIGVRAGEPGGAAAPQILGNSDFLDSKRNLGKASF